MNEEAYEKWGDGRTQNLVVVFASNNAPRKPVYFEWQRSFSNAKDEANYDVLFFRDQSKKWYIGGVPGIGKNITHTTAFLKKQIQSYDNVIFMGVSAGGYASILFGSILNINATFSFIPQTDLVFAQNSCPKNWKWAICDKALKQLKTYDKYKNLVDYINDTTDYYLYTYDSDEDCQHGAYHLKNISKYKNVYKLDVSHSEFMPTKFKELSKKYFKSNGGSK